jgi:hypothetical protein
MTNLFPQEELSMSLAERTHIRPSRARRQQREEQAIALRRAGLSYRAIGAQMSISHTRARQLCEMAFADSARRTRNDTDALLGQELDRLDGVIRAASAILHAPTSTPMERLRAVAEIRRCSDSRVRWLGLAAPEKLQAQPLTRQELSWMEAQALPDDALEDELRSLGYVPVAEAAPLKDEDGATMAEPTVATASARAAARS